MRENITYTCETCGLTSPDRDVIAACEAVPVQRIGDLEPGEIIAGVGHAMGKAHFTPKTVADGWLLEEPGDPDSRDHHERNKGGWNKWVLLDKVLPTDPRVSTSLQGGWAHRELLLLYAPHYCCCKDNGPRFAWATLDEVRYGRLHRLGRVSDQDLDRYRATVNGRQAGLI